MKRIINFYKNLTFFQGVTSAVVLTSVVGIAATVGPMKTFTPGTVISSSEVNANFNALKMAIETNNSQVYKGTWDASTNSPDLSSFGMFNSGEYYIVTNAGTYFSIAFNPNDWIIFNGSNWEKIPSSSTITSVFGRTGVITPTKGDYVLNQLGDVDLTTPPVVNNVLKFDGATWRAGNVSLSETDPTVSSFAKNALPTCGVNEVLKADGTILSCVTDNNQAPFAGTADKIVVTNASGALATSTVSPTQLSTLVSDLPNKADRTNMAQTISAATITGLSNPLVSSDAANKSYVDGMLSSFPLAGFTTSNNAVITSTDNTIAAFGKTQAQINSINSAVTALGGNGQWSRSGSDLYLLVGNVGISTSFPSEKLEVTGNIKASNYLKGNYVSVATYSTASSTSFHKDGALGAGMFFPVANEIAFSSSNTERLRITGSGSVGIGITNPNYALDVVGDINASGNVRAGGSSLSSDKRLKTNISTIKSALEKVLSLRGVEFNWIKNGTKDLGVIAQEVEKIFPTLVMTDKKGMKSVKYSNMAGVFIESTKELNAKVVTLEAENKMLKTYLCDKDPYAPFCK